VACVCVCVRRVNIKQILRIRHGGAAGNHQTLSLCVDVGVFVYLCSAKKYAAGLLFMPFMR